MQSAASPSLPHSPTSTNHTESSPGGMQTGDHCGHPRAVLPQKWSPPSAPGAGSLQRRAQPAGAVRLQQRPQPADAESGWLYHAVAHQPRGGVAADPVSSSVRDRRDKEGARSRRFVDPRARRATHHGLQAWLHGLGRARSADWARFELARGAVAAVAVLSCRQAGCVPAGGWLGTRSIHYTTVSRECVACSAMLSPS